MSKAWAQETKDLKSRDAKLFVWTANHLLLQRIPALTTLVRGSEKRLYTIALDRKLKSEFRLDAIKALVTLGSDTAKLAPLLAADKSSVVLRAIAIAIGGPQGRVASEAAVTTLIGQVEKPGDWSPQYNAIITLRYFDDPRVEPTLRAALKHAEGAVRREALDGLGHQRASAAVSEIIEFLGSTNPQHVAAAARALSSIGGAAATKPLADKKRYAHALKLAKNEINGRFGVRALQWFTTPTVDDDLLKLAGSEDGEVADGACDGLLHRRASHALAPLAKRVFAKGDASYYGRFFLVLLNGMAAVIEKPPAKPLTDLAGTLSALKPEVLEELLRDSDQLRYRIDRLDAASQQRVAAWRDAMCKKIRAPKIRALAAQLMTAP